MEQNSVDALDNPVARLNVGRLNLCVVDLYSLSLVVRIDVEFCPLSVESMSRFRISAIVRRPFTRWEIDNLIQKIALFRL